MGAAITEPTDLQVHRVARASVTAKPAPAAELPLGKDAATRALNVLVAAVGLVVAAPLMLAVAVLVKLTSRGPAIYRQVRVGMDRRGGRAAPPGCRRVHDLGGRPFVIYKFRTMSVDAEASSGAVWATRSDPRVTKLGAFLRKSRIDELPQLWNVLKGDMDIVGPRPERPTIFADLRERVPGYHLRQRTRPGITGLAQISQAYDTCLDDVKSKVRYDLEYIRKAGLLEDARIMAMTLPVMILRKGGW